MTIAELASRASDQSPSDRTEKPVADGGASEWGSRGHEALMRIPVAVKIVLGTARMPLSRLMAMSRGAILPLDRKIGSLVDIMVNDRLVARGEVVVLDEHGERFAIAVREVVRPSDE